jgi:copper chaperone CopZ
LTNDSSPTEEQPSEEKKEIRFSVASISCVACTPAFKKGLERVKGISDVRQLPMLNKVIVEYDPSKADEARVKDAIFEVADRAGFKGKVIISK